MYPEEPPKIDWSYYKANAANKAVVEQLEKQYNSLKIPYPSDGGAVSKIEQEEKLFVSIMIYKNCLFLLFYNYCYYFIRTMYEIMDRSSNAYIQTLPEDSIIRVLK